MEVREKLVELLTDNLPRIGSLPKCDNPLQYTMDEIVERIADHLIMNGVTVQEWVSVTEMLPEKGEDVLVFNIRENWTGFAWLRPDETWTALGFDFPFDLGEVTHWMPLPSTEGLK